MVSGYRLILKAIFRRDRRLFLVVVLGREKLVCGQEHQRQNITSRLRLCRISAKGLACGANTKISPQP